jgi:hypothetical protein
MITIDGAQQSGSGTIVQYGALPAVRPHHRPRHVPLIQHRSRARLGLWPIPLCSMALS